MTFTTDQILDLDGVAARTDRYEYDLLSLDGLMIGQVHPDADRPPTVSFDSSRRIGRTMNDLRLPASELADIDPVSMAIQPHMVLQNGDRWPLGVFRWATPAEEIHPYGVDREADLVDRSLILDQELGHVFSRPTGFTVVHAIVQLAQEVLPPDQISWVDDGHVLAAPLAHAPNTNRIGVMNDLAALIGYAPMHFARFGHLQIRPMPNPMTSIPDLFYSTQPGDPNLRIIPGTQRRWNNLLNVPNEWTVYDPSGDGAGIAATVRVDPSAPHSYERRGYRIPRSVAAPGLATYEQATLMALSESLREEAAYEWYSFTSTADPRLDAYTLGSIDGVAYLGIAWSQRCRQGAGMACTFRRVYQVNAV